MDNKIKQIRNAKNMTQKELSRISGIPLRTIQRYEKGETNSILNYNDIANAMEVGLGELFEGIKVNLNSDAEKNMTESDEEIKEVIQKLIDDGSIKDAKYGDDEVSMIIRVEKILERYLCTPVLCAPADLIDSIVDFDSIPWGNKLLMLATFHEIASSDKKIRLNDDGTFTVNLSREVIEVYFDNYGLINFDNPFATGKEYVYKMDIKDICKSGVDSIFEQDKYIIFATVSESTDMFQFNKFRKYFDGRNLKKDNISLKKIAKKENVSDVILRDLIWKWIKYGFIRYGQIDESF